MKTETAHQTRWAIRRDLPEIMAIENASFPQPWSEEDFLSALRLRNAIGMVVEHDGEIAGFMVYQLHKDSLELMNFAVSPHARRRGLGRAMLDKLKSKLAQQRRRYVSATVRERNVAAQLFFRACGFRATDVIQDAYEDSAEDGYRFVYQVTPAAKPDRRGRA